MKKFALLAAALLLTAPAFAGPELPAGKFDLDAAHSKVGFEVTHLVINTVSGQFDKAEASLDLKSKASKSKVSASIDVASINTGNAKRDEHLKSPDFFDAAKFPTITFKSSKFELEGDKLSVTGDLTMKGVTKPVTLSGKFRGSVVDPWGMQKVGASLSGAISRKDFGITWNKVIEAGPVVGDEVTLVLNIEGSRPAPKK